MTAREELNNVAIGVLMLIVGLAVMILATGVSFAVVIKIGQLLGVW